MDRVCRIGYNKTSFILNTSIEIQPHYSVVYEKGGRYYVFLMGEIMDVTNEKNRFIKETFKERERRLFKNGMLRRGESEEVVDKFFKNVDEIVTMNEMIRNGCSDEEFVAYCKSSETLSSDIESCLRYAYWKRGFEGIKWKDR